MAARMLWQNSQCKAQLSSAKITGMPDFDKELHFENTQAEHVRKSRNIIEQNTQMATLLLRQRMHLLTHLHLSLSLLN
jgi:hypothetical protein